jgi:hypothetical protein
MANLTTNLQVKTRSRGTATFPIASGITLPVGALVQVKSGELNHWDGTGLFVGIHQGEQQLGEGVVAVDGPVLQRVAVTGASSASPGSFVYCADSNPANMTLTGTKPIGRLIRYRSATDCDVMLLDSEEYAANVIIAGEEAGGDWSVEYEGGTALSVDSTTGFVGIGTESPGSNKLAVREGTAGSGLASYLRHDDNTNGVSHAFQWIASGGASGGDAFTRYEVNGTQSWSVGIDNSDGDKFKICAASVLSNTGLAMHIDSALMVTCAKGLTVDTTAASGVLVVNDSLGFVEVTGGSTIGRAPLVIDQNDEDEPLIAYDGTSEAGTTKNITTYTSGASIQGFVKIAVEGASYWMPYYSAPTS